LSYEGTRELSLTYARTKNKVTVLIMTAQMIMENFALSSPVKPCKAHTG